MRLGQDVELVFVHILRGFAFPLDDEIPLYIAVHPNRHLVEATPARRAKLALDRSRDKDGAADIGQNDPIGQRRRGFVVIGTARKCAGIVQPRRRRAFRGREKLGGNLDDEALH